MTVNDSSIVNNQNASGNDTTVNKIKLKYSQHDNIKNLMNNIALITKKVKERGHSQDSTTTSANILR